MCGAGHLQSTAQAGFAALLHGGTVTFVMVSFKGELVRISVLSAKVTYSIICGKQEMKLKDKAGNKVKNNQC